VTDGAPAWSAVGTKIAFSSTAAGDPDIYSMNADGGNRTQLTNSSDLEYGPTWSPDGSKIAYIRDVPLDDQGAVRSKIYIMNADGSEQVPLLNSDIFSCCESSPSWSPDGTKIAFTGAGSGEYAGEHVYTANPDGSDLKKLTSDNWYTRQHPDWSPDGSKIVFARYDRTDLAINPGTHRRTWRGRKSGPR
jgi:TolB protein